MSTGNHRLAAMAIAADLYAAATLIILTEDGPLGERVRRAYSEMGIHGVQLAPQLPELIERHVLLIHRTLTGLGPEDQQDQEMALRRTITAMTHGELVQVATEIAELSQSLEHELDQTRVVLHSMA